MSDKVVHKFYWDFEKEERWLNEMGSKGSQLVRYERGAYHFEQGKPGTWIYRIELLPADPHHEAAQEYLSLLLDTGAETLGTHQRWVYLRRRATSGPFDVSSDLEARVAHYQRARAIFTALLAALAASAALFVVGARNSAGLNLGVGLVILVAVMIVLMVQTARLSRQVSALKAQRQDRERGAR